MNLLAIETATECCSVALYTGSELLTRSEIAPRRHGELLLPMCDEVLADAGISRRQLDAIAVGRGPGAFTGVRLAISAAQGIALALDIPVIPVSSLAALALAAPDDDAGILAVIDARMGEIYAGAFRRGRSNQGASRSIEFPSLEPLGPETVGPADQLELPGVGENNVHIWNVVGSGWTTYREQLIQRLPAPPRFADGNRFPQAADVARLARPILLAGRGVAPELALPTYLRDKVALTLDEQRAR